MPKPRKMLGDAEDPAVRELMGVIETQSVHTLAGWAASYVEERYMPILRRRGVSDARLDDAIIAVRSFADRTATLTATKPAIRAAREAARAISATAGTDDPAAVAAAQAVATACATPQTPTSALGFVFYGAAAVAYDKVGWDRPATEYEEWADGEFRHAAATLRECSVPDEPDPATIRWNC